MGKAPLEGIRIADFTWVWAGPYCTLQLAHMGADVIRIETKTRPCVTRMRPPWPDSKPGGLNSSGYFNQYNQGKRGITLNFKDPAAIEVARRLVAKSDVGLPLTYDNNGNNTQGLNGNQYTWDGRSSSGARSFLTDILGSTLALTDSSGTMQTQYTYEPFGNATVSGAANDRVLGDEPLIRRAVVSCPIEVKSGAVVFAAGELVGVAEFAGGDPNLYGYVAENPVNFTDADGLGFRRRSPTQRCAQCGAPHGGLCGDYCPDCDFKSRDPNGGVPPNPSRDPGVPVRPNPNDPGAQNGGDQGGSPGDNNSQFHVPPPPPWILIIPLLPWPGNPLYGGL